MKNYYLVYELYWVLQNANLNGFFMSLVQYIKYMLSILDFLNVSHLKSMTYLYHGSEKCEN